MPPCGSMIIIMNGETSMRSLPNPARLTTAALYLRLRDARRHRAVLLRRHGPDFPGYLIAEGQWIEAHNALQVVLARLDGQTVPHTSPKEMLRIVAQRARGLAKLDAAA